MRRMTKIRIASGRTHRRARIWQRSSGAAAVTNSSTLLARVVAARAVASSRWRQYARQTKFQIRIRIARQRTLGTVTRMPQDTLDRRVSELKISVRKWRFFGRAQCRIGEIRIQILPGKTPCDDNYYPSTDISFFFFFYSPVNGPCVQILAHRWLQSSGVQGPRHRVSSLQFPSFRSHYRRLLQP